MMMQGASRTAEHPDVWMREAVAVQRMLFGVNVFEGESFELCLKLNIVAIVALNPGARDFYRNTTVEWLMQRVKVGPEAGYPPPRAGNVGLRHDASV